MLQTGSFGDGDANRGADGGPFENVEEAISSIISSGTSWFGLAILSGKVEAVLWVYRFIAQHYSGEVKQSVVHLFPEHLNFGVAETL